MVKEALQEHIDILCVFLANKEFQDNTALGLIFVNLNLFEKGQCSLLNAPCPCMTTR